MSEKKLRVLSITHTGVQREAGRLRYHPLAGRDDLDVHVVVPKTWYQFGRWYEADAGDDPGITTHILPIWFPRAPKMSWYLHIYPGLNRLIKQVQPDVIHLWEEPWSLVALQALLLRRKAAYVLEVDQNIQKKLPFPFETLRRYVLRHTDHVLPRTGEAEAVIRGNGYTGPVTFVGYGVDQQNFHPVPRAKGEAGSLVIGYVGRLIEEKGLDDALDALAVLPEGVRMAVMGEGPHEASLRARISQLGLERRVSIRGWGKPAEVADFIRSLDILLLLTRTTDVVREQFGRVILEAQSCGVPVLGSTCGAIPDVTGPGGWIVPELDPAAIAACLRSVLADPAQLNAKAEAGLANIEKRFTFSAIASTLAQSWRAAYSAHH